MWLASVSKRTATGRTVPASTWSTRLLREGESLLRVALAGVGREDKERCFRMCLTLCMHRVLSDVEIAALPEEWKAAPALDIAGAPVEVLWSKGLRDGLSTQPCRNPGKIPLDIRSTAPVYLIDPCGECETCRARTAVVER